MKKWQSICCVASSVAIKENNFLSRASPPVYEINFSGISIKSCDESFVYTEKGMIKLGAYGWDGILVFLLRQLVDGDAARRNNQIDHRLIFVFKFLIKMRKIVKMTISSP